MLKSIRNVGDECSPENVSSSCDRDAKVGIVWLRSIAFSRSHLGAHGGLHS